MGPAAFEAQFGLGEWDEVVQRRKPLLPTDIFTQSLDAIQTHAERFNSPKMQAVMHKRRLLLASSDVHEHAIFVLQELLSQAGAEVISLGAEQNPADVVAAAERHNVEAILISTHNGMALDYAQRLQATMAAQSVELPVLMGGVLNQKVENEALPVDVTADLKKLGIQPVARLDSSWQTLLPAKTKEKLDGSV
ncbi:MAG: cobalamin B12-binding domain-containing protein [Anaerolineae bacterium]